MGLTPDHLRALVATEGLNGPILCPCFRKLGDGRVAHRVRRDFLRIETRSNYDPSERRFHAIISATLADRVGEDPAILILCHITFILEYVRNGSRQRLFPLLSALTYGASRFQRALDRRSAARL